MTRPARERPHAGDRLGELALAVPGDAGDAEDLARPHVEGDVAQRRRAAVACAVTPFHLEDDLADRSDALLALPELDVAPDHHRGERLERRLGGRARLRSHGRRGAR